MSYPEDETPTCDHCGRALNKTDRQLSEMFGESECEPCLFAELDEQNDPNPKGNR